MSDFAKLSEGIGKSTTELKRGFGGFGSNKYVAGTKQFLDSNSIVAKVAFSMHTSIFGIIFSVTLTLLNTLFPIKVVRNDIYQHLLNSVERLWYRIHGSKIDPYQEKVLKILERIEGQAEIVGGHFQKSSKSKSAKTYTSDKEAA